MANEPLVLDFIRHPPTVNPNGLNGITDVALDSQFEAIAKERIKSLAVPWDKVITSPLKRCAYYGQWIAHENNLELTTANALREYNFGDWDGESIVELNRTTPKALYEFYSDPIHNAPPNAEPFNSFYERIEQYLLNIARGNENHHIGVINHAGVMRAILSLALNLAYQHALSIQIAPLCHLQIKLWTIYQPVWQITRLDNPILSQ